MVKETILDASTPIQKRNPRKVRIVNSDIDNTFLPMGRSMEIGSFEFGFITQPTIRKRTKKRRNKK